MKRSGHTPLGVRTSPTAVGAATQEAQRGHAVCREETSSDIYSINCVEKIAEADEFTHFAPFRVQAKCLHEARYLLPGFMRKCVTENGGTLIVLLPMILLNFCSSNYDSAKRNKK